MRVKTLTILTTGLVALLALPVPTRALDTAAESIPITDPALLESMGFAPDETNVYATPQALQEMAMGPAERAAQQQALAMEESSPAGGPYGATAGYSTVSYQAFRPARSSSAEPAEFGTIGGGLYCIGGTHTYDAQIESLPHGAVLDNVRFWLYDTSVDEDITAWLFRTCQRDSGSGNPLTTTLGEASTDFAPGNVSIVLGGSNLDTIDNQSCSYWLRARLDNGGFLVFNCSEGTDLRLHKARAGWRRQVSPGPSTATFNDVPASHPFFQNIEALAASGITSGCGGGGFCPNASLTRGQMAVFLSTALGLHWDTIFQGP